MESLCKETKGFFLSVRELAETSGNVSSLFTGDIDHDEALLLVARLNELERIGLIVIGPGRDVRSFGAVLSVSYPSRVYLTDLGKNYERHVRSKRISAISGIVASAVLSGFFCWLFVKLLG